MQFWTIIVALGVPTAVVGTIVGILVHRIEKRLDDEKEARRAFELFQVKGLMATMKLSEANAIALQNGKCNGETHSALEYVKQIKREEKEFLFTHGVEHLF